MDHGSWYMVSTFWVSHLFASLASNISLIFVHVSTAWVGGFMTGKAVLLHPKGFAEMILCA